MYLFYVIYLFQVHRYLAVIWTTAILFSIFPLIGWNHYLSEVSVVGNASTIRTPYFCKLFHYLFITFVFLFFLFWSKCQIHSCLAGVIIYGSKSSSEFFTPQNDEWIIIWHFWRVFDTLFLYYLHITLLFSCLALGRFSAIPKKDQYIFVLSFLDNTRIVKSDYDQSTVQTGELFHIKS